MHILALRGYSIGIFGYGEARRLISLTLRFFGIGFGHILFDLIYKLRVKLKFKEFCNKFLID
jgi:hypothetical protein